MFVILIIAVIAIGYGALKLAGDGLLDVQRASVGISTLKTSSEKLLQVRLALGSYETLFSVSKQTDALLSDAQKLLVESNADFGAYASGSFESDVERSLAQAVARTRPMRPLKWR